MNEKPQTLASPSPTLGSMVAVCSEKRGSRSRSLNFAVCGMPTSQRSPSNTRGSIGLIRGEPSERNVASSTASR